MENVYQKYKENIHTVCISCKNYVQYPSAQRMCSFLSCSNAQWVTWREKKLYILYFRSLSVSDYSGSQLPRTGQERGKQRENGEHGLSVQFARTDPRKYSFAVRTVENWNKLPEDVKTSRNGEEFKNKLKKL
jgi:hypothetical protein